LISIRLAHGRCENGAPRHLALTIFPADQAITRTAQMREPLKGSRLSHIHYSKAETSINKPANSTGQGAFCISQGRGGS
jgi:hypothetical protein